MPQDTRLYYTAIFRTIAGEVIAFGVNQSTLYVELMYKRSGQDWPAFHARLFACEIGDGVCELQNDVMFCVLRLG